MITPPSSTRESALILILGITVVLGSCARAAMPPPQSRNAVVEAARAPAEHDAAESPYRSIEGLPEGTILHVPTGVELTKPQLFDLLAGARVVYVGESHDNFRHHQIQLEILRGLADRFPGRVAVGMEMFQRPAQAALDRWSRGEMDQKELLAVWYENWTEDFAYYREILEFVRDRRIPLVALNAAENTARALAAGGIDGLSAEERAALPEIDAGDPFHRRQMEAVFGAHAKGEGFDAFYRTMLLWDETMAQTVAEYVTSPEGRDKRLIVFAGGGHIAHGFGIPRRAFRRAPVPYATVIPQTDVHLVPTDRPDAVMQVEPFALPLPVADIVWATGYEGVASSQVRLGVRLEPHETGVRVLSVDADSAAAAAGVHGGDVIVAFDGQPVRKPVDVVRRVRAHAPGDRATLTITRGPDTLTVEVAWPK